MRHGFQENIWRIAFFNSHGRKMVKKTLAKDDMSAIFVDLLKAFYAINHDLLLAKLKTYGSQNKH